MAETEIKQSRKNTEPALMDVLNLLKKDIMLNLNCHAIAQVQSFDSAKQTISATMMYQKTFFTKGDGETYSQVLKDYPILLDVPIVVMGGGNGHLTFPIAQGDECLILFNDRSIDNWFKSGQVVPVASSRLHSFSDGIAIVGLNSLKNSISNYDSARAVLFNGTTGVGVGAEKVKIYNQITTLNTLMASLIDAINAITTTNAVPGAPCALSPASIAAFTAIKTQIAGLLE